MHPEFSRDDEMVQRFEREARLAAKVEHPNVVSVYAHGRDRDRLYLAAEFIDGLSVKELIQEGKIPSDIAAYIVQEAARGLKAAHEKSVLHRDIKPANIMISREGRVKVTDFGMASLRSKPESQKGNVRGTLAYLSPEQIVGAEPTESSDLFSLGATLFEMLAGEPAFQGDSWRELLDNIQNVDPMSILHDDDDLPPQLRRICQQMLKKKPAQRYQNTTVLLSDLDAFRKTRGNAAIANAVDVKSFLADPEAYRKRQREKHVTVRERVATPRTTRTPNRTSTQGKAKKKPTADFNLGRIFSIVAVLVVLFAGLSFAGSFFFSKDGQFGGQNNSAGASKPTPASDGGNRVRAGRGGRPQSGGAAQAAGAAPDNSPDGTVVENAPAVALIEEGEERNDPEEQTGAPEYEARPASSVPDTVILSDEPGRVTGRIRVDATPWAYVYIDGDSVGVTPMPLVASPGTYPLTLHNPDFPPFETLVDVIPGRETPVQISLWTLVGTLQVDVFPFARISIDGEFRDETPLKRPLIVKPGSHTLTLSHPSLGDHESTFEISAGESKTLKFNLEEE